MSKEQLNLSAQTQIEPPRILPTLKDADKKEVVAKDIDNHLYSFTYVHGKGMDAMAHLLHRVLNVPIEKVKASMGRVYNDQVGTFDFKELVENMDIVVEQIVNNVMRGFKDKNKGALYVSKNMVAIVNAAKRVYQKTVAKHLKPYLGVPEMMQGIKDSGRKIFGLTDAPKVKTITRLRALKLIKYFDRLYAQPTPKLNPYKQLLAKSQKILKEAGYYDSPQPDIKQMLKQGKLTDQNLAELLSILQAVYKINSNPPKEASDHITVQCEAVLEEMGHYETDCDVIAMQDQRKPNIDLSDLFGMTRKQVTDSVVMCGDNPKSDMQLAVNNRCVGFYSQYGQLSPEEKATLMSFGQKESTENRNLDSGDDVVRGLKRDTRNRIYVVQYPIQILDLLGIERPDHMRPRKK